MTMPSKSACLTRARVEPVSDWQFQFTDIHDCGFVATILPVRGWDGALIELIAWKLEQPHRWWLRSGLVPTIGEDLAELARLRKEPTWLADAPAQWFELVKQGREDVACIVNWDSDPRLVMTDLDVHCSPEMSRRLRRWWAEHSKMNFRVTEARRAA